MVVQFFTGVLDTANPVDMLQVELRDQMIFYPAAPQNAGKQVAGAPDTQQIAAQVSQERAAERPAAAAQRYSR